jgi:hypothetical protein
MKEHISATIKPLIVFKKAFCSNPLSKTGYPDEISKTGYPDGGLL